MTTQTYDPLAVVGWACGRCQIVTRVGDNGHDCPAVEDRDRDRDRPDEPVTAIERYGPDAADRLTGRDNASVWQPSRAKPVHHPADEHHIVSLVASATRQECVNCLEVTAGIPAGGTWICATCSCIHTGGG